MPEDAKIAIALEIQSRLDQVRLIRAAVVGILEHLRVIEQDILVLELAVSELVNNSVEHGYAGAQGEQVRVQITVIGSIVQVQIIDHAAPFPVAQRYRLLQNPVPLEDPDEEWTSRGHGIQIVRQIVDSITLDCDDATNVLTFTKRVTLRED